MHAFPNKPNKGTIFYYLKIKYIYDTQSHTFSPAQNTHMQTLKQTHIRIPTSNKKTHIRRLRGENYTQT